MSGRLSVVVGAQFGSEGKGAIAAHLTRPENNPWFDEDGRESVRPVVCVRVGGPNAGHTVYGNCPLALEVEATGFKCPNCDSHGHPWRLRQIPVAAVSNPEAKLVIAAGSEVDLLVLMTEVRELNAAGYDVTPRLSVDASATLLTPRHQESERNFELSDKIGSTGKGIGAARADRIWRQAGIVADFDGDIPVTVVRETGQMLHRALVNGAHVVIEGTQGYGLGLHTRYYPQVTSGDCRAVDFLAQAGISPWHRAIQAFEVYVVARVRPIRVAGNSGPLAEETTWDELGLPEERTTVTKKVRRVGEWDPDLVHAAVLANGGGDLVHMPQDDHVVVALTMADHLIPELAGQTEMPSEVWPQWLDLIGRVEKEAGARVAIVGTGPTTVIELGGFE